MIIKTSDQLKKMRVAGKLAAQTLEMIAEYVKPGVSTEELDNICHNYITEQLDAIAAPLNYRGFPKSICTSVNQVICHGIPSKNKILKQGDIINIDVTVIKDGYHGDTSRMFAVGKIASHAERLIRITQECLYLGIEQVKAGATLGDIGAAIQAHATKNHYSVVRDYCGHGIGQGFHEEPQVLHYGKKNTGISLQENACITIEPMINAGSHHCRSKPDGWTVVTQDGRLSAQFEHTLAITKTGCQILTLRSDEQL